MRKEFGVVCIAGAVLFGLMAMAGFVQAADILAVLANRYDPIIASPVQRITLNIAVSGIFTLLSWGLWSMGARRVTETGLGYFPFVLALSVFAVAMTLIYASVPEKFDPGAAERVLPRQIHQQTP